MLRLTLHLSFRQISSARISSRHRSRWSDLLGLRSAQRRQENIGHPGLLNFASTLARSDHNFRGEQPVGIIPIHTFQLAFATRSVWFNEATGDEERSSDRID